MRLLPLESKRSFLYLDPDGPAGIVLVGHADFEPVVFHARPHLPVSSLAEPGVSNDPSRRVSRMELLRDGGNALFGELPVGDTLSPVHPVLVDWVCLRSQAVPFFSLWACRAWLLCLCAKIERPFNDVRHWKRSVRI